MGSIVTVNKHRTNLDDWLSIHDKLQQINFNSQICNHLSVWKVAEENNQNYAVTPLPLDLTISHSLICSEEAYIILFVKDPSLQPIRQVDTMLFSLLNSIYYNIEDASFQNCLKRRVIGNFEYFIYAYFGKNSNQKAKLMALSYAYKMEKLVDSENKLKIITGGGVFRNKKLQMGSILPFCKDRTSFMKDITQYRQIHLVSQYLHKLRESLTIFKYKPTLKIPVITKTQTKTSTKPPALKLSLKPYEQVTYDQIAEEQDNGMKFNIRATARHELKMQKFSSDCSQIIEGLYVSGQKVAKDQQLLKKNNITEIINCAGDYCENWHQDKGYNYLTFFLKDSQLQNIECLFYRAIQFINTSHRKKKNVLIHCIQGISRSVTLIIAYLIYMNGYDYKTAQSFVKKKRGIACPNNGFMVELIQFHKRLYDDFNSLPSPRVFLVSSHSKETPDILTARLLKHSLFESKKYVGLDCRGMYIVQTPEVIYLWVGSKLSEGERLKRYWAYAQQYIKILQKDQKAPMKVKGISQGNQGRQFFTTWNMQQPPQSYENQDYTKLFSEGERAKPGGLRKYYERDEQQPKSTQKLFIYPDYEHGLGVFELDDLSDFCVLVKTREDNLRLFIWRDEEWEVDNEKEEEFLDKLIGQNYNDFDLQSIEINDEGCHEQSQSFLESFV